MQIGLRKKGMSNGFGFNIESNGSSRENYEYITTTKLSGSFEEYCLIIF